MRWSSIEIRSIENQCLYFYVFKKKNYRGESFLSDFIESQYDSRNTSSLNGKVVTHLEKDVRDFVCASIHFMFTSDREL